MWFLIPLALSLFTAGAGIVSQVSENNRIRQEGEQAVADQESKNEIARISDHIAYVNAIDQLNAQQTTLDQQAAADAARTQSRIRLALYGTAVLMALLTIVALIQRKQDPR